MPDEPSRENSYVLDTESATEQVRILHQDRMITKCMGGPLRELEPTIIEQMRSILDLACGPGGWALGVARTHPEMEVVGVDISQKMVRYANAQADVLTLDNVTFQVMEILGPLMFPDEAFDVVNARLIASFMPAVAWPKPSPHMRW